jgi:hypothetical protein
MDSWALAVFSYVDSDCGQLRYDFAQFVFPVPSDEGAARPHKRAPLTRCALAKYDEQVLEYGDGALNAPI